MTDEKPAPVVTMVFPANIMTLWAQIEPLIEPALVISGTHDLEDVRKKLLSGGAQLWVEWTHRVEWAMVTELVDYPLGLWLRVWLAGALPDAQVKWDLAETAAVDFALANKCAGIEHVGRNGWGKRHEGACNTAKGLRVFRHIFEKKE